MNGEPKTLLEAVNYFSDESNCRGYIASRRWPEGATCPVCGSKQVTFLLSVKRYQCSKRHPKRQFTIKTGTIFEDSPLPLQKWLVAMWLLVNCKNGVSSYEVHRDLGVTQKTAWFMLQRIRLAMQDGSVEQIGGHVEIDETYIGGKARNMHKQKKLNQRGMVGKAAVMGFLERGEYVRTMHIENTSKAFMEGVIRANVVQGSNLYSDQHGSYRFLNKWFKHQTVDHAVEYVTGNTHTNGLENYWSLLKRTLRGTYVSVEPFHLFRYLDEQSFRYNERRMKDFDRMHFVASSVAGRRLTYKALTGKGGWAPQQA
jgi:hypothetical protein